MGGCGHEQDVQESDIEIRSCGVEFGLVCSIQPFPLSFFFLFFHLVTHGLL